MHLQRAILLHILVCWATIQSQSGDFDFPGEQCGNQICPASEQCCFVCDSFGDPSVPNGCSSHCPQVACLDIRSHHHHGHGTGNCFERRTEYIGSDLNIANNGPRNHQPNKRACQRSCQDTSGCNYWVFVSHKERDQRIEGACYLKSNKLDVINNKRKRTSGPKFCKGNPSTQQPPTGDCSCSDYVDSNHGFGKCQKDWKKGPLCYVNLPSSCADLQDSRLYPTKKISWKACTNHKVDCQWGQWTSWSGCSTTCGTGQKSASRQKRQEAQNGGKSCQGSFTKSETCYIKECPSAPVDCQWGQWTSWSRCSTTCGSGRKSASRQKSQEAQNGGKSCQGSFTKSKTCHIKKCPSAPINYCGINPHKIVGGSEVTPYSIPWQVALVCKGKNVPFCGGTLIDGLHILTAAHCLTYHKCPNNFYIIVGKHQISDLSDGIRHEKCLAVQHPEYFEKQVRPYNDFAIVHLKQPVKIGPRAFPACLPKSDIGGDFLAEKTMTVSGWGRTSSGGRQSAVLHTVNVPGITNAQCNAQYAQSGRGITNAMLCAGDLQNGGIDSCQADSGGPLTYDAGGKTTVVGVVSWGHGCGEKDYPGVYARVTEAMDFINEELGKTCSTTGSSKWNTYGAGQKGCTGEGNELFRKTLSLDECKSLCISTPTCNGISFRSSGNVCHGKYKPDACTDTACQWDSHFWDKDAWSWYWRPCLSANWIISKDATLTCEIGNPITNKADCKEAAISLGFRFNTYTEHRLIWPIGCFQLKTDQDFYFNPNPTGVPAADHFPVCGV